MFISTINFPWIKSLPSNTKLASEKYNLDAVISLNNYHAGYAAVAHNPCLTVPMGLRQNNEPAGVTFIGKSFEEELLYQIGFHFEKIFNGRVPPENSM